MSDAGKPELRDIKEMIKYKYGPDAKEPGIIADMNPDVFYQDSRKIYFCKSCVPDPEDEDEEVFKCRQCKRRFCPCFDMYLIKDDYYCLECVLCYDDFLDYNVWSALNTLYSVKTKQLAEKDRIIDELHKQIEQLKTEAFYRPGGEGEMLAENSFNQLSSHFVNNPILSD